MRLKNIKLVGFKSFVDPTTVSLPTNLCAVVGPNGCGKSNIIDAVRWVMGESSAKNLRGESATDVIFNGSTSRQPVGQASIELVFDNSDHTLAGEYASYNEVSIKRKVTREGLSIYFLNNQKCRRRDVTGLFLGTGLGPRSYSIIEQGMISRLIESRPEELRVYIEEAAGISRYKERRRETSNSINRTRDNIERLDDICDELMRQLETLKRQAAAAEQYTQLKDDERKHQFQLAAVQWRDLRQKLLDQRIGMGRIQDEITLLRSENNTRFAQLGVQKNELASTQEDFNVSQAKYYQQGADIARLEQTLEHQRQQEQQWQLDYEETQRQLDRINQVISNDSRELEHMQQQQDQLSPDIELAQEQLLGAEMVLQTSEDSQKNWQAKWNEQALEQAEAQRQLDIAKTNLQHHSQRFETLSHELQRLREERDSLAPEEDSQLQALATQVSEALAKWEQNKQRLVELEANQASLRQEESASQRELGQVKHELSQVQGQVASLDLLIHEAQQELPQCPQDWLQEGKQSLLQDIKVDPGWEAAVEQVLNDWLYAPYVQLHTIDQEQTLQDNPGLSVLVEPMLFGSKSEHKPLKNNLLEKIQGNLSFSGWLGQVVTAANLDQATALLTELPAHASVVLPSGIWLGHGWLRTAKLSVGDEQSTQASIFKRKQHLDALVKQKVNLQQAHDHWQKKLRDQRYSLETNQKKHIGLRLQVEELQLAYQQSQQQLALQTQRQAQGRQQYEKLQERVVTQKLSHQELAATIKELAEELEQLSLVFEEFFTKREILEQQKKPIQEQLQTHQQQHNLIQQQVVQLQARVSSVEAQKQSLTRSLERLQEQNIEWHQRQEEILERAQQQDLEPAPELQIQLGTLIEQRMVSEAAMHDKRQIMTDLETGIRELDQQQLRQEQEINQREQFLQEQRLVEREVEVTANNIKQQMAAQNVVVEKLAEILPEQVDDQTLRQQLEQTQSRIKRLGAINLMAIDEYQEQSERKTFLDEQRQELVAALNSLETAIRKIDRETRSRFKDTFDRVNTSLKQLFPKVFGGGRASLELTDDDLLATGVTIMAQPPGKRNSSIHLLSGGEKALTAIALVFSIFKLNPSPFCMLDEVDAPLDDANVERYTRLVKEMSDQVQFIYISHNKIAMEMAHQLMGVTMQESGVSRLVTVDIDEAVNMTLTSP